MTRYTDRPFPPYRHLPGKTPHPERSKMGHMYGREEPPPRPLTEEDWADNADFLFGVDLFNAGYFWEAHTSWERLWAIEESPVEIRRFLQSIIQTSAACLKVRQGELGGARKLLARADLESLGRARFGVDPKALARDARRFVEEKGEPPHLYLSTSAER